MAAIELTPSISNSLTVVDEVSRSDPEPATVHDVFEHILAIYQGNESVQICMRMFSKREALRRRALSAVAEMNPKVLNLCLKALPEPILITLDPHVWSAISVALRNEDAKFLECLSRCQFKVRDYKHFEGSSIEKQFIEKQHIEEQRYVFPLILAKQMKAISFQLIQNLLSSRNYEAAMLVADLTQCSESVRVRIPGIIFNTLPPLDLGPKCATKTS
jgi:hypothetical protein